jgi:Fe-S cluster biogenesis protein NfuA
MAEPLDEAAVEARLVRLDEVLGRLEHTPGATAGLALEAVQALTEVYGTALARMVDLAPPPLLDAYDRDVLLRHLMVLHDVHPHPLEQRVHSALDSVRPYLHSHGGDVTLVSIADGVVRVAFTGHCDGCTSSTETMADAIRTAVLAVAPELDRVEAEATSAAPHPPPVIPVDSLLHRPVAPS